MTSILYTVAIDERGNLVKANDAEKDNDYFCPICKTRLILRKSGKTGKGSKRPHYAHRSLTINCTPETALHYSFKNLLAKKIDQHLKENMALPFSWQCKYCGEKHSGDLLKKIQSVEIEYDLTVCRPDIALIGKDQNVMAAIEIVVTHKPDENVIEIYKENNIILIQINLTSDSDIDNLENKIASPDIVETCYNPKCKSCGHFQQKLKMTIIDGPCWKCRSSMKIATISSSTGGLIRGLSNNLAPSKFTEDEISFARSKGVLLNSQFSKTAQNRYLANCCGHCDSFAGDYYLFTQYIAPASLGEFPSQAFDIGYNCEYCDEITHVNEEADNDS